MMNVLTSEKFINSIVNFLFGGGFVLVIVTVYSNWWKPLEDQDFNQQLRTAYSNAAKCLIEHMATLNASKERLQDKKESEKAKKRHTEILGNQVRRVVHHDKCRKAVLDNNINFVEQQKIIFKTLQQEMPDIAKTWPIDVDEALGYFYKEVYNELVKARHPKLCGDKANQLKAELLTPANSSAPGSTNVDNPITIYEQSRGMLADLSTELVKATKEVWFFGTNFYSTTSTNFMSTDIVVSLLQKGVSVHYLVFNPESVLSYELEEKIRRLSQRQAELLVPEISLEKFFADDFQQTKDELHRENENGIRRLAAFQKECDSQTLPGRLVVHLTGRLPKMRAYFLDPEQENGLLFFVPYMNRRDSPDLPGFLLNTKSHAKLIYSYLQGVKSEFNHSDTTDLQKFLAKYPQYTDKV